MAAVVVLAGCSSSTEPRDRISSDGLAVRITVDQRAVIVGDFVTATLMIRNTTSNSVARVYPSGDPGPNIVETEGNSLVSTSLFGEGFFGPFFQVDVPDTLSFAPRQARSLVVRYVAVSAGAVELTGCLTKGDAPDILCSNARVTVTKP